MKIVSSKGKHFITYFRASPDQIDALAGWMHYCKQQQTGFEKSTAADLWQGWLDETFIGFSGTDKIMLHSGHRAAASYLFYPRPAGQKWTRRLSWAWKHIRGRDDSPESVDLDHLQERFRRHFPEIHFDAAEATMAKAVPNQYTLAYETWHMSRTVVDPATLSSYLEIGAGAGIHLSVLLGRCPSPLSVYICDLPHSISIGYLFLSTFAPGYTIRFPTEWNPAKPAPPGVIQYLTPDQLDSVPEASIDLALNTSSFPEMDLATVNGYLNSVAIRLRPGGILLSKNLLQSRYLEDNTIQNYDFSRYQKKILDQRPPYCCEIHGFELSLIGYRK